MEDSYRFLRYEFPGLSIFLYLWLGFNLSGFLILPSFDIAAFFAAIALPIGYILHQAAIYYYPEAYYFINRDPYKAILARFPAGHEWKNVIKGIFDKKIGKEIEGKINDVIQSLLHSCYYKTTPGDNCGGKFDGSKIYANDVSNRWNHFFARKEIGIWAPLISSSLWLATLLFSFFGFKIIIFPFWWIGLIFFISLLILGFIVIAGTGAEKVKTQIDSLENLIVQDSNAFLIEQINNLPKLYTLSTCDCPTCKNDDVKKVKCKRCNGAGKDYKLTINLAPSAK